MQAAGISINNSYPMNLQDSIIKFPLWQYLNQPIFSATTKLVLSPRHFGHLYRVQSLERCWDRDYDSQGRYRN